MTTDTESNGDRLRAVLEKQGRSEKWLAEQVGMSRTHLSRAINGKQGRKLTRKQEETIATVLGFPTAQVFKVAT